MPNRDKTGPNGDGPRTGRGLGLCGDRISKISRRYRGFGREFRKIQNQKKELKELDD